MSSLGEKFWQKFHHNNGFCLGLLFSVIAAIVIFGYYIPRMGADADASHKTPPSQTRLCDMTGCGFNGSSCMQPDNPMSDICDNTGMYDPNDSSNIDGCGSETSEPCAPYPHSAAPAPEPTAYGTPAGGPPPPS